MDLVFLPKKCHTCLQETPDWVCSACHQPSTLNLDLDAFAWFGWNRPFFLLSLEDLRQRFYERSRQLHPDKSFEEGPDSQRVFLEATSRLNQAYETLQKPALRRAYILKKAGFSLTLTPSQCSPELRHWLDFFLENDLDHEEPGDTGQSAGHTSWQEELLAFEAKQEAILHPLEIKHDASLDETERLSILKTIHPLLQEQTYLRSLKQRRRFSSHTSHEPLRPPGRRA